MTVDKKIIIRNATAQDFEVIWEIFHNVVKAGDTYTYDPQTTKTEAQQLWMPPGKETFVALMGNEVVGTYYLKPNQLGLGKHVANAGYMVHPGKQGFGIGKAMAEHSFMHAKEAGYLAMQFNFVVSTNTNAVKLWEKLGFKIIGTVPKAYNHKKLGYVDAYIMHKFLD